MHVAHTRTACLDLIQSVMPDVLNSPVAVTCELDVCWVVVDMLAIGRAEPCSELMVVDVQRRQRQQLTDCMLSILKWLQRRKLISAGHLHYVTLIWVNTMSRLLAAHSLPCASYLHGTSAWKHIVVGDSLSRK
jgi:hypothetical protein